MFRNNRSSVTTATLGVTATKDLTNFTASAFNSGSTDNNGTFILIPVAILFLDRTATVTTTKTVTNVVASIYQDIGFRNNSRVTTAIDLLDTGFITTIDDDMALLARGRQVVGLVTAAIDGLYLVGELAVTGAVARKNSVLGIFLYLSGRIDVNRHLTRGSTIEVVTSEDTSLRRRRIVRTADDGVLDKLIEDDAGRRIGDTFIHRHSDIAIHVGCGRGITQAATVGITDVAACQTDRCRIAGGCLSFSPGAIDRLLVVGRAAVSLGIGISDARIDAGGLRKVACHRRDTRLEHTCRQLFIRGFCFHSQRYILNAAVAIPVGCIRVGQCTAAIDIVDDRAALDADADTACHISLTAAAEDIIADHTAFHGDSGAACNGRGTETAAIDIVLYGSPVELHCRRTCIGSHITATIDIADDAGAAVGVGSRCTRLGADLHIHRALRCTVDIVTSEDIGHTAAADDHLDRTEHIGCHGCHSGRTGSCQLTQTTAIEVTRDGTSGEGDVRGGINARADLGDIRLGQCAAAIDIACDTTGRHADIHGARDITGLTAAEGIALDGAARDGQCGSLNRSIGGHLSRV